MSQRRISEIFSENLRALRGTRSQAEFARHLGFKATQSYAYYEEGRTIPKDEVLKTIADKLGISPQILLYENLGFPNPGDGSAATALQANGRIEPATGKKTRMVPVISWMKAGAIADAGGNFSDLQGQIDEWLESEVRDPNAFCLIVEGNSMEPMYLPGDRVIFSPNEVPRNNDVVVARLEENGAVLFKRFKATGPEGQSVVLESINPDYKPLKYDRKDFRFIYPAVDMRRIIRR